MSYLVSWLGWPAFGVGVLVFVVFCAIWYKLKYSQDMRTPEQIDGNDMSHVQHFHRACQLVYQDYTTLVQKFKNQFGYYRVRVVYEGNTCVVLALSDNTIDIFARGTVPSVSNFTSVLNDLRALVPVKGEAKAQIGLGFKEEADNVWDEVYAIVQTWREALPHHVIRVGGHSLGHTIAGIIAWRLHHAGLAPDTYISFGGPKWSDCVTAGVLGRAIRYCVRVVNNNDVVTRVPVSSRWGHVEGRVFFITAFGNLWHNPHPWFVKFDRAVGRAIGIAQFRLLDGLGDHGMEGGYDQVHNALSVARWWAKKCGPYPQHPDFAAALETLED